MKVPERVLVTGATGAVGPRIVHALLKYDCAVRVLSRANPAGLQLERVEVITGDITNVAVVDTAVRGCDAVIHLAALLHIVDPPAHLRPQYEAVNVGGTRNVVEAALQAGVRRLVYFSTINVYGATGAQIVDEDTPPRPQTYYAETKLAAEQIVLGARTNSGAAPGVVLRLGAVYGARIKGNYERLVRSIARGRFLPVGDGSNRRTLVYDKDVAQAAVLALQHPDAAGRIYNVTDGHLHTVSQIVAAMSAALGKPPPRLSIPVAPVRLLAGIAEEVGRWTGIRSPIIRSTIDKYTEGIAVDGSRIQRELGFKPQYDLQSGWREAIAEMQADTPTIF